MVSNISKCIENTISQKDSSKLKTKLTTAVVRAIQKFENRNKGAYSIVKQDFTLSLEGVPSTISHHTTPEIKELEQRRSKLQMQLRIKEEELRNLNRRVSLTKDLTRNDAIRGLVSNIVKKFKTLSKEKQKELVENKGRLARVVENYIKDFIVFYDIEENAWGVAFTKKHDVLDSLSTGKDAVVLAINLSSKYVHLTTSTIYHTTLVHYTICRKERDELKERLAEVNLQLQIAYARIGGRNGFRGGFGNGGRFGGGGASGIY